MILHHHPGPIGPSGPFFWPLVFARLIVLALFIVVPWIIALAYIWRDANRRGQPGWLWALAGIFLSWFGVLAYLIVRAFTNPTPVAPAALRGPTPPYNVPPAPPVEQPPAE